MRLERQRAPAKHKQKDQTRYQRQNKDEEAQNIQQILEEFKGIKKIANIKSRKRKILISHVRNENGEIEASRQSIANTFAKFYSDLYSREKPGHDKQRTATVQKRLKKKPSNEHEPILEEVDKCECRENKSEHIPEFTKQEFKTANDCLKRGKAGDNEGIKADDQECDDEAKEMIGDIYNEITKQERMANTYWKKL